MLFVSLRLQPCDSEHMNVCATHFYCQYSTVILIQSISNLFQLLTRIIFSNNCTNPQKITSYFILQENNLRK
jgi:hypothetical protein